MEELTFEFLKKNNLILIDKSALMDLMADVNRQMAVEKKYKWIDKRVAVSKYAITESWLRKWRNKTQFPESKLRVKKGTGRTSTVKYNEQSIINELERQEVC